MLSIFTLVTVIFSINLLHAANHDNFKTCNQSSFCRRNRNVEGKFLVDRTNMVIEPNFVTFDIVNLDNNKVFMLTLRGVENNMFHFEIDERSAIKTRYRVRDLILPRSPSYSLINVLDTGLDLIIHSGTNKVVVSAKPIDFGEMFRMDFYYDDVIVAVVNGGNLLRFEHRREKPDVLDPSEDPDSWEETFREFTDSKPNGPEGVAVDFHFPESEVLFGIPEHADTFILKTTLNDEPYRLYNVDMANYELESRMPLYGAIPVIYGHGPKHTAGIFWLNTADTFIDNHNEKTTQFISESGIIDVFVMLGPKPNDVFAQYTDITGRGFLPPIYSLGMHQSRWNYMTQEEVHYVVENYDKNAIPLDTIWLDIEYTDGKRYFTWNLTAFPNPVDMMSVLRSSGRHLTYIIDPHIKSDPNYFFNRDLLRNDYYIKDKNGEVFLGKCWPEESHWIDFLNPAARQFYARHYSTKVFTENAIDTGIWNDMNEPSVFDVAEGTMYKDSLHFGGVEHRNVHNMYGYLQTKATHDGLLRRGSGEQRTFILTRSFFSGSQRYTALWTGDNTAEWGYLLAAIQMCLSISVSGISFCGGDIGGFLGNPDEELQVRWTQAAVFQPFVRNHADISSKHREPYLLTENNMKIAREAIRIRYKFLPFWYTLFYEHTRTGVPVMRPMLSVFPEDSSIFKLEKQYMLSDKLLVAPVTEAGASSITVHFPGNEIWYDLIDFSKITTGKSSESKTFDVTLERIPVFVRGGSIIPIKERQRSASIYMKDDPISLIVAVNNHGQATGTLYIDDEVSFAYMQGFYAYYSIKFEDNLLSYELIDEQTKYKPMNTFGNVSIVGLNFVATEAKAVHLDGTKIALKLLKTKENFIIIDATPLNVADRWVIEVNSALDRKTCTGLIILTFLIHVFKILM